MTRQVDLEPDTDNPQSLAGRLNTDAARRCRNASEELQRVIWRMEKLPRKEEGAALWVGLGRCMADLERIRDDLKDDDV